MLKKTGVFRGDKRLNELGREFGGRHQDPFFLIKEADGSAIGRQDLGGQRGLVIRQGTDVRQLVDKQEVVDPG